MNEPITIVDRGRGPQLSSSRITVLDVFYYLHRGYDYDFIHRAMPSLSQEDFNAVAGKKMGHSCFHMKTRMSHFFHPWAAHLTAEAHRPPPRPDRLTRMVTAFS